MTEARDVLSRKRREEKGEWASDLSTDAWAALLRSQVVFQRQSCVYNGTESNPNSHGDSRESWTPCLHLQDQNQVLSAASHLPRQSPGHPKEGAIGWDHIWSRWFTKDSILSIAMNSSFHTEKIMFVQNKIESQTFCHREIAQTSLLFQIFLFFSFSETSYCLSGVPILVQT